ncbi:MAG: CsgG/HfaB family protein [Holophagales bacterium]|nr:CsgG/HfaB family protein [Holophagales bacterium]
MNFMTYRMISVYVGILAVPMATTAVGQETAQSPEQQISALANRKPYTAQRKPRVTVMQFDDTNTAAQQESYGASVSAMLTTFFKDKSQFVIVERQNIQRILDEWKNNQGGLTNLESVDPSAREILEKIDVIVLGNVTILGDDIEIDAKLLSRADARIIAAAQRGGPKGCLRRIVERLGIALEQAYLRPYYGKMTITVTDPENTSISLTPVLLADALDEEKPPVELETTISASGETDHVEHWITDPTSYTIENILSGWYTLQLERPGYETLTADHDRWVGVSTADDVDVYYTDSDVLGQIVSVPSESVGPEIRKFLVRVDPLRINAVSASFSMRKKGGVLGVHLKRQFIDEDFVEDPESRASLESLELAINGQEEQADVGTQACQFFSFGDLPYPDLGAVVIRGGDTFRFDTFKGGNLRIEEYQGERLPIGRYKLSMSTPYYEAREIEVTVADAERAKIVRLHMDRSTRGVRVLGKGGAVSFEGQLTGYRKKLSMNAGSGQQMLELPLDRFLVSTDAPGLGSWSRVLDLMPGDSGLPTFGRSVPMADKQPVEIRIKSGLWVAGRTENFPVDEDSFYETEVGKLLDRILISSLDRDKRSIDLETLEKLRDRLGEVDLLILDEKDMKLLKSTPEAAAIIRGYIQEGRALLAFVSAVGEYRTVLGVPLRVVEHDLEDDLKLQPGLVSAFDMVHEIDLGERRALPELEHEKHRIEGWRVLSYTKKRKHPRVVEAGRLAEGGYVLVWAESSKTAAGIEPGQTFDWSRLFSVGQEPKTEGEQGKKRASAEKNQKSNESLARIRRALMSRAVGWAQYLMYRRLDRDLDSVSAAEEQVESLGVTENRSR